MKIKNIIDAIEDAININATILCKDEDIKTLVEVYSEIFYNNPVKTITYYDYLYLNCSLTDNSSIIVDDLESFIDYYVKENAKYVEPITRSHDLSKNIKYAHKHYSAGNETKNNNDNKTTLTKEQALYLLGLDNKKFIII